MRKIIAAIMIGILAFCPSAFAITTSSSVNLAIANNADGWQAGGGTTARLFTITGSAWTLGNNTLLDSTGTFTLPAATDTLVGRASTDTLTNKTLTTPVINGLPTGTGIATAASVSTLASRDANGNAAFVNELDGYSTTATAGTTTTLTVASNFFQFFTGSTTQTVTMPVTSTLVLGQSYWIVNQSTGAVTVQSSGSNAIVVVAAGTNAYLTCILTSGTTAASWASSYSGVNEASGKVSAISNSITLAGTDGTTMTFPATTGTVDVLNNAQTFTAVKTFTNSDLALLGSSTGATTFTSANASGTNYTLTIPASTDTMANLAGSQTFTNKTITSNTNVLGGVTMTLGSDATADVYYRNSSGYLTRLAQPGANEVLGYDSTDAIPAYMVFGSGITYTHSTHTISVSGSGFSPMTTTMVAASSQSMTTNNAYGSNDGATLVTFTLPTTAAVGDEVMILGYSSGGWKLAQNASGQIIFGSVQSTSGTGGYLSSNNQYDSVHLKCVVANNIWTVVGSQGNITVN